MADYININNQYRPEDIPPETEAMPDISDDEFAQIMAEVEADNRAAEAEFDPTAPDPSLAPEQPAPEMNVSEKTAPTGEFHKSVFFCIPSSMIRNFKSKKNDKEYAKISYPMYRTARNGQEYAKAKWNAFVVPKSFVHKDQYDKGLSFFSLPAGRSTNVSIDINNKYQLSQPREVNNEELQSYVAKGYEKWAKDIKTYAYDNLAKVQADDRIPQLIKDSCERKVNYDFNPPENVKAKQNPERTAAKIIRNHTLNAYSPKGLVENARGYLRSHSLKVKEAVQKEKVAEGEVR